MTVHDLTGTASIPAHTQGISQLEPELCPNCSAPLAGSYCARCGQKRPHPDLTLRELLQETTEELVHWEGKVPSTIKTLFLEPGRLTLDFLAGRRARWLPPLRLYLICSVAFFVSGPLLESITHRSARQVAKVTLSAPDGSKTLTPEARREIAEGLPGRLFGPERLERAAANSAQLNRAITSAYPKAMFVLLPLFALLTNIAWRRSLPRYPAHLYLSLHLHAALFGALTIATLATALSSSNTFATAVGLAALAYILGYFLIALHRVFRDSWTKTLAKAIAVGAVYSVFLIAVSLAMLGYAIATM